VQPLDEVLQMLADETAGLVAAAGGLTDAGARAASLLPRWTRGHVLTHLARNAEGGVRLLRWARTGVPGYEYPSLAARAADIEAGAGRPAALLAADVSATSAALAEAAAVMPPGAWEHPVTWTTGEQTPAELVVHARLAEVLLHHADLGTGYGPGDWPAAFTAERLPAVVAALTERGLAPLAARLDAADTGRSFCLGSPAADGTRISGTEADLLAWLLGRSEGGGLDAPGPLPAVPSVYLA